MVMHSLGVISPARPVSPVGDRPLDDAEGVSTENSSVQREESMVTQVRQIISGASSVPAALSRACTDVFFKGCEDPDLEKQTSSRSMKLAHLVLIFHVSFILIALLLLIVPYFQFRSWILTSFVPGTSQQLQAFTVQSREQRQRQEVIHFNASVSYFIFSEDGEILGKRHSESAKEHFAELEALAMDAFHDEVCSLPQSSMKFSETEDLQACLKLEKQYGQAFTLVAVSRAQEAAVWHNFYHPDKVIRDAIMARLSCPKLLISGVVVLVLLGTLAIAMSIGITRQLEHICRSAMDSFQEIARSSCMMPLHEGKEKPQAIPCCVVKTAPSLTVHELGLIQTHLAYMSNGIRSLKRYHDPALAEVLLRSCQPELAMAEANVTVLFSDIADFTSIAEALQPQQLLHLLRMYLEGMGSIIIQYKGVIGEFMGDGILAWWNTPVDIGERHTLKALQGMLAQQKYLCELNASLQNQGLPSIRLRMGLVRGDVLAGNLGCSTRMKFGLVGDSVNLASRLEGLCKTYGVSNLVDRSVVDAPGVQSRMVFRPVDMVKVKGRNSVTEIFEIVCRWPADDTLTRFCQDFQEVHDLYRSGQISDALEHLKAFRARWPSDRPAELLEERWQSAGASLVKVLDHK